MSFVDTAEIVYVLLNGNAGLVTTVTDSDGVSNIYGPPGLPIEFTLRKAVLYLGDGGPEDAYTPISKEDFTFFCYGRDSAEARQVFIALKAALRVRGHRRLTVGGSTVIYQYGLLTAGPSDRLEPIEGWPYVYCGYRLHFIETTVT